MIIRSRAPVRISFGGGGTDLAPYCNIYGGVVLNATINKYVYVTVIPNNTKSLLQNDLESGNNLFSLGLSAKLKPKLQG